MNLLWIGFALGCLFGAAARASSFCLLRGLRQALPAPGTAPAQDGAPALQAFALALAVALLATQALVFAGQLGDVPLQVVRPSFSLLATLGGGVLFGVGMVLARSCGARALVLLAGGNLRALLTLLCLGLTAQATMTGVLAPLHQWLRGLAVVTPAHPALSGYVQALGLPTAAGWLLAAGLPAAALLLYALRRPALRRHPVQWAGATLIGALAAAGWWASSALADPFEERAASTLSFIGPVAESLLYLQLAVGRQPSLGAVMVAGTLVGAAAVALLTRSARWESFTRPADMAGSAAGGVLMGLGGVLAVGCSIGQGISGLATLALASLPAVAGILLGSVGALAVQNRFFTSTH